ncbi:MAG TPA: hypothetical protein VNQ34_01205 [Xanthobacteraceae bacterium]|jgi:hypothetical protein|nr:hypothetical protein [Xanthobacteraceae bacterium]
MPTLKTICISVHSAAWRELGRPEITETCLGAFLVFGLFAIGTVLPMV